MKWYEHIQFCLKNEMKTHIWKSKVGMKNTLIFEVEWESLE